MTATYTKDHRGQIIVILKGLLASDSTKVSLNYADVL